MLGSHELFRREVLDTTGNSGTGSIVIIYPISNYLLLFGAFFLLTAFTIFVSVGQYTRRASIPGVLEPAQGVIKLYAPQQGVLKRSHVAEGQVVRKGDVLLEFEMERTGSNGRVAESEILNILARQLVTLDSERRGTLQLNKNEFEKSRLNLIALEGNHRSLQADIEKQERRVNADSATVKRYEQLQNSGFMPDVQLQQKKNDLTDQQLRLESMRSAFTKTDLEIARLRIELSEAPLKSKLTNDQLDRAMSTVEADITKQQINQLWRIVAPNDGTVTGLGISSGQRADTNVPLLSIVPKNAALQATINAPSRSIGFLKSGQSVQLRIDAFPYQKFGTIDGKIISISDSPLTGREQSSINRLAINGDPAEPTYTVRVELNQQTIIAYGAKQKLRAGLQLTADVALDTRRIFEWIIEPLYSLNRA